MSNGMKFGTIIGMTLAGQEQAVRLMMLAPLPPAMQASLRRETWWATVLLDDDAITTTRWAVGQIVTVSPGASGIVILEEAGEW